MKSFKLLLKNWKFWLLCYLIDAGFIYVFMYLQYSVMSRMAEYVKTINEIVLQAGQSAVENLDASLTNSPEFLSNYFAMFKLTAILLVGILAVWLVFQCINWWITRKLIKKTSPFVLSFVLWSAVLYIIYVAVVLVAVVLSQYLTFTVPNTSFTTFVALIAFFVLLYFGFVAYSVPELGIKRILKLCLVRTIMWNYLISLFCLGVVFGLSALFVVKYDFVFVGILVFILVFIPLFSWARIRIALSANESVHKTR